MCHLKLQRSYCNSCLLLWGTFLRLHDFFCAGCSIDRGRFFLWYFILPVFHFVFSLHYKHICFIHIIYSDFPLLHQGRDNLFCRACNLYFDSPHNKRGHMSGKKHLAVISSQMARAGKHKAKIVIVKDSAKVKKKKRKKPQNLNHCKFHLLMIYRYPQKSFLITIKVII